MIVRRGEAEQRDRSGDDLDRMGGCTTEHVSDMGGLSQFGAYVETLQPGASSSDRHWHEAEDEFLHVLSGEATVVQENGEHVLHPGDSACWKAGVSNAHRVVNRADLPCTYLIVGTRAAKDVVHYPDLGRTLYNEGKRWRLQDSEGLVIRQGEDG